jgi:protein-L-isoaspartate(D-aspartate) O-methyltransferase
VTSGAAKIGLIMELRGQGITDTRVLSALEKLPREDFVHAGMRDRAYDNTALPIGHGQTISQPFIVAFMTERLDLGKRHNVLEIGTGSGYQTAVLARLCRRVYTVERHRELTREAEARFAALKIDNIVTRVGDGSKGWPEQAPFDRIIVTAAAADVPHALAEQLRPGGIMMVPVGSDGGDQEIVRVERTAAGFAQESLLPVRFVPLVPGLPRADSSG